MLQNRKIKHECGVGGRTGGEVARVTCRPVRLGLESGRRGARISGFKIRLGFPRTPTFSSHSRLSCVVKWHRPLSSPETQIQALPFSSQSWLQVLPRFRGAVSSAGLFGGDSYCFGGGWWLRSSICLGGSVRICFVFSLLRCWIEVCGNGKLSRFGNVTKAPFCALILISSHNSTLCRTKFLQWWSEIQPRNN